MNHDRPVSQLTCPDPNPTSEVLQHDDSLSVRVHRNVGIVSNDDQLAGPPTRSKLPNDQLRDPLRIEVVLRLVKYEGLGALVQHEAEHCCASLTRRSGGQRLPVARDVGSALLADDAAQAGKTIWADKAVISAVDVQQTSRVAPAAGGDPHPLARSRPLW